MNQIKLLDGELIKFSSSGSPATPFATEDEIDAKYVAGEVRIVTEQARYPLVSIPSMIASGSYKLRPDFQRRHRWDTAKKSRLIESFIMNVPIPPIFLYEDSYSHYEVMDGLQRLTTICDFYSNTFALEGLDEWPELIGMKYSELPSQVRRGIDRRYISSVILLQETAKDPQEAARMKQLVFERLNSGGIKLEPQEARNAIYPGPLNNICIRLARNKFLCRMWGIPEPLVSEHEESTGDLPAEILENELYRRMDDVELVLRFFAYRQRTSFQRAALSVYLDRYLKQGNTFPTETLNELSKIFEKTAELVYNVLGEQAFWLWRKRTTGWGWFSRPTTVLFDPIMFAFSNYLDHAEKLMEKKDAIKLGLPGFYQKNYASFEGRYTNLINVAERNTLFLEFIGQQLAQT
jgi:hypothetical protein